MNEPAMPYLLFHPRFICKFGNRKRNYGAWDFRQIRTSYEKEWWKEGCFAIDKRMRRFELVEVISEGPAWTWVNIMQPRHKVFLAIKHVFEKSYKQLTFDEARAIYVEAVCRKKWWSASGETEAEFRARSARYHSWKDLIEPVFLAGKLP